MGGVHQRKGLHFPEWQLHDGRGRWDRSWGEERMHHKLQMGVRNEADELLYFYYKKSGDPGIIHSLFMPTPKLLFASDLAVSTSQ